MDDFLAAWMQRIEAHTASQQTFTAGWLDGMNLGSPSSMVQHLAGQDLSDYYQGFKEGVQRFYRNQPYVPHLSAADDEMVFEGRGPVEDEPEVMPHVPGWGRVLAPHAVPTEHPSNPRKVVNPRATELSRMPQDEQERQRAKIQAHAPEGVDLSHEGIVNRLIDLHHQYAHGSAGAEGRLFDVDDTSEEYHRGGNFYHEANAWVKDKANHKDMQGGSVARRRAVAGALSSLSPGTEWENNKAQADHLINHFNRTRYRKLSPEDAAAEYHATLHPSRRPAFTRNTVSNYAKAFNMLRGGDPDQHLGGHKVRSFYNATIDPHNKSGRNDVVMDRHAVSAAVGGTMGESRLNALFYGNRYKDPGTGEIVAPGMGTSRKHNTNGTYAHFADAYRDAHARLTAAGEDAGAHPAEFQAKVWGVWRKKAALNARKGPWARNMPHYANDWDIDGQSWPTSPAPDKDDMGEPLDTWKGPEDEPDPDLEPEAHDLYWQRRYRQKRHQGAREVYEHPAALPNRHDAEMYKILEGAPEPCGTCGKNLRFDRPGGPGGESECYVAHDGSWMCPGTEEGHDPIGSEHTAARESYETAAGFGTTPGIEEQEIDNDPDHDKVSQTNQLGSYAASLLPMAWHHLASGDDEFALMVEGVLEEDPRGALPWTEAIEEAEPEVHTHEDASRYDNWADMPYQSHTMAAQWPNSYRKPVPGGGYLPQHEDEQVPGWDASFNEDPAVTAPLELNPERKSLRSQNVYHWADLNNLQGAEPAQGRQDDDTGDEYQESHEGNPEPSAWWQAQHSTDAPNPADTAPANFGAPLDPGYYPMVHGQQTPDEKLLDPGPALTSSNFGANFEFNSAIEEPLGNRENPEHGGGPCPVCFRPMDADGRCTNPACSRFRKVPFGFTDPPGVHPMGDIQSESARSWLMRGVAEGAPAPPPPTAESTVEGRQRTSGLESYQPTTEHPSAHVGDADIAKAARAHLAMLSASEQAELINEPQGQRARNFDRLRLEGTHYMALEAQLAADDEDVEALFL